MSNRKVITGSEAAAQAVKLVEPKVIAAYPITPQTYIIERLAEFVAKGELQAKYICTDSELTSIGTVAGAVCEGVRAFTATASQGVLFMHEALHWIAGGRLPVVMVVATRGVGAPWILMSDLQDAMSQRDTGWMMIFASNAQEIHDFIPIAYKVAEKVCIPCMVCLDGFLISHTAEPVNIVEKSLITSFLPEFHFPLSLNEKEPFTLWPIPSPEKYYEIRRELFEDHIKALNIWIETFKEWKELTQRDYSLCEGFMLDDAKKAFVSIGATGETTKEAVKILRKKGEKVGAIILKVFRPFPERELLNLTSHLEELLVIDKAVSMGKMGILAQEIKSSTKVKVKNFIGSMGGLDLDIERLMIFYEKAIRSEEDIIWI